ncbi:NTP transferase domain-containing protein [bacterium]|nr:NTP transferase domain-containing protein [bacterium]
MKNYAIILASGSGERFGSPKQFEKINSKTILEYTVNKFENCDLIDEIIVVVN